MGSFPGHVVPGTYLILQGIWWITNVAYRSKTTSTTKYYLPFRSSSWFLWNRYPSLPIEPVITLVLFACGSAVEVITGNQYPDGFRWANLQHMGIYGMSLVTAAVQILLFRHNSVLFVGFDYICMMAQVFLNIVVFYNHLHGRPIVDVMLHMQMVYVYGCLLAAIVMELTYKNSPLFPTLRGMLLLLLGLNFVHTGFILYPPLSGGEEECLLDLHSHQSLAKVNGLYAFETCFSFLAAIVINVVVSRCYHGDNLYARVMQQQLEQTKMIGRAHNFVSDSAESCLPAEYCNGDKRIDVTISNDKHVV